MPLAVDEYAQEEFAWSALQIEEELFPFWKNILQAYFNVIIQITENLPFQYWVFTFIIDSWFGTCY